jgi:hypothetical protein
MTAPEQHTYCTGCKTQFVFVDRGYFRSDLCIYCEDSLAPWNLGESYETVDFDY